MILRHVMSLLCCTGMESVLPEKTEHRPDIILKRPALTIINLAVMSQCQIKNKLLFDKLNGTIGLANESCFKVMLVMACNNGLNHITCLNSLGVMDTDNAIDVW